MTKQLSALTRWRAVALCLLAGAATCMPIAEAQSSRANVVRFLEQATFGQTPDLINQVEAGSIEAYLNQQFAAARIDYPELVFWPVNRPRECPQTVENPCQRNNYTMYPLQVHFFTNALYSEDQLRQRVAWALSQILVTGPPINLPAWMRQYQQLLYANSFGKYRDLLYEITVNPAMGNYLDMLNNRRFNPVTQIKPNENFAREILQLFSVGIFKLNQNGTLELDTEGNPIPTYGQDEIEEFSKVFTGWTLDEQLPGPPEIGGRVPNYRDPMVVSVNPQGEAQFYEQGEKRLLNGVVLDACAEPPANCLPEDVVRDLNATIDNIMAHQNVAPFISKQLIQRLVTSNPSPDYVQRVADVFAATVDSDTQLQQVVRAILLDSEARDAEAAAGDTYGHLREPVVFITNLLRAFNPSSDGVLHSVNVGGPLGQIGAAQMDQEPFRSPSVFNFYLPDYEVPGYEGVLGPEFHIFGSVTALRRSNFVNQVVMNPAGIPADPETSTSLTYRPNGTQIDLSPMEALAGDPEALVNALDDLLLHGTMPPAMRDIVVSAVNVVPESNPILRARQAVYLVATSPQFQVER